MSNSLPHAYTYQSILEASLRVNWQVADLIGDDKPLDFQKPFLPDALVCTKTLKTLSEHEKLLLNQIRGNSYLHIFGLVEEFILPFVVDYAKARIHGDRDEVRSLLQFAEEETKHIQLFEAFSKAFADGFGTACPVIGPAQEFAQSVLAKSPLAVVLVILHIEWMTQRHYLECVQDNQILDPQFASLLKHHWIEEAQHAKIDTLITEALFGNASKDAIKLAMIEYLDIIDLIDAGLQQQVEFDLNALEAAAGRVLTKTERKQIYKVQLASYRHTFLISGMTHPEFVKTLKVVSPKGAKDIARQARIMALVSNAQMAQEAVVPIG